MVQTSRALLFRAARAGADRILMIGFNNLDALKEFEALDAFTRTLTQRHTMNPFFIISGSSTTIKKPAAKDT